MSSDTILDIRGLLSLGASTTAGRAIVLSIGVFVTSCSGCENIGVRGVRGDRTEELDDAKERVDSVEDRTPVCLFLRGEVEPKMALLPAKLANTSLSTESWSWEV